ncbi:MAG: phage holin family protein [Rhodothalassiaceae bacterium]
MASIPRSFVGRLARQGAVALICLALALLGLYFLLLALYLALAPQIGQALAALLTGGLTFLLTGLIGLIGLRPRRRRAVAPPRAMPREEAMAMGLAASDLLQRQLRASPLQTLLISAGLGVVLGANPGLVKWAMARITAATRPSPPPPPP